jgi:hypothetical protein
MGGFIPPNGFKNNPTYLSFDRRQTPRFDANIQAGIRNEPINGKIHIFERMGPTHLSDAPDTKLVYAISNRIQLYRRHPMEIPRHWRLNAQRYRLEGSTCRTCSRLTFPPRRVCPHCAARPLHLAGFVLSALPAPKRNLAAVPS